MITNEMMFNKNTLNVFTDASIIKNLCNITKHGAHEYETVGCAGATVAVMNDNKTLSMIDNSLKIVRNSTSNNSEIEAVKLGIQMILQYRRSSPHITTFNLVSDSKLCIYGLREWIFNWVRDARDNSLIGSTGQEVANQDVILQIIYMIMDNELSVNLYHQNGHININNQNNLMRAKETFIKSNFLNQDVDIELIKNISTANNYIDNLTRDHLTSTIINGGYPKEYMIRHIYVDIDVARYSELINKGDS